MDTSAPDVPVTRRSKRRLTVSSDEPTPRDPIRRGKRKDKQAPVEAVNGSRNAENGDHDEESPSKKIRLETEGEVGGRGDDIEMEDQESEEDQEKEKYREKNIRLGQLNAVITPAPLRDLNLSPCVSLVKYTVKKDADPSTLRVKPSSKGPVGSDKSVVQTKSLTHTTKHDVPHSKPTSMAEYRSKMEALANRSGLPTVNHHLQSRYSALEKTYPKQRQNLPKQTVSVQHKMKEEIKKTTTTTKSAPKRSSKYSCRGFMWYLCRLVLLVLLGSAVFLAFKNVPIHQGNAKVGEHVSRAVSPELFAEQLTRLESQYPNQLPELWKRSKIHLERHLKTAMPTEPVSLILTAGRSAEKTLHCLAQGIAYSFSSALNASVLHIDGASKSSQNSDQVKLDIDNQLRAAFEGDKPVAIIHRFEELPPGSTLIFYRYCDHEYAAYKKVFLLFTVLLPQDEVGARVSLHDVEELVLDYVKEKLVGSSSQTAFNEMDNDKYGGLWSRISHLILPVMPEKEREQKGC